MSKLSNVVRTVANYLLANDSRFWHKGNLHPYGNQLPQYINKFDGTYTPYQATVTGTPYIKFGTLSISKKTWAANYRYRFEFEVLLWASNKPARMNLDVKVDLASNGTPTVDGMLRAAEGDTYYPVATTQVGYILSTNNSTDLVVDLYITFPKNGSQLMYKLTSARNNFPTGNTWYGMFKYSAWKGVKLYDDTQGTAFDSTTTGFVKFDRQVAFNSSISTTDLYTRRDNGNSVGLGDVAQWQNTSAGWLALGVLGQDGNFVLKATHDYAGAAADWTLSATEKTKKYLVVSNSNAAVNIIAPTEEREYTIVNKTSYAVTIKKSGGTGVSIAAGKTARVFYDVATATYVRTSPDV